MLLLPGTVAGPVPTKVGIKIESRSYTFRPCFAEAPQRRSRQVARLAYIRPAGVRHCGRSEAQLISDMSMGLCSAASIAESPLLGERIGLN